MRLYNYNSNPPSSMKMTPAHLSVLLVLLVVVYCQAQELTEEDDYTTEKPCPANCDISQCAQVIADECVTDHGQIIKDECDCCPVCEPIPKYEPYYEQEGAGDDTVMMIVNSTHKEACSKIQCNRLQICSLNIQGIPMCRCPTQFFCRNHKMSRKDVCALDGETYRSRCFLRIKECGETRRIGIKHRGPCFKGDRLARKRLRQQKKKVRGVGGRGLKKDERRRKGEDLEDRRNKFDGVNGSKRNRNKNENDDSGKKRKKMDKKGGRKAAKREEKRKERREEKLVKKREQRLKDDKEKKRNRRRKMKRKERRATRGKRSCPEES